MGAARPTAKVTSVSATNTLGPYLVTKNLLRRGVDSSSASGEIETSASPVITRALHLLIAAEFPTTMASLFEASGWPMTDFAEAIAVLRRANLLEVIQGDDGGTVRLTEQGRALRSA